MSRYSRSHKITVFIIKRINYGEADKIITVFSKEQGKQVFIAKGIRKIKSRRAGALELFNHIKMMYHQGNGMGIITETELIDSYQNFSSNYFKTNIAYQIVELIDKLTKDEQDQEDLYELLNKAFKFLKETDVDKEKYDKILLRFKSRILEILGFGVPKDQSIESLTQHIEEIIEKELVAGKSFAV